MEDHCSSYVMMIERTVSHQLEMKEIKMDNIEGLKKYTGMFEKERKRIILPILGETRSKEMKRIII